MMICIRTFDWCSTCLKLVFWTEPINLANITLNIVCISINRESSPPARLMAENYKILIEIESEMAIVGVIPINNNK